MIRPPLGFLLPVALAIAYSPAHAQQPVPSWNKLPTGNGFGFAVFDGDKNAIVEFLERPYRYMRANPGNPDADGIVRRNLAFDTYFGLVADGESVWLSKQSPSEFGYVEQTGVIRSTVTVGSLKTESYFFQPYGIQQNALMMVLKVTNQGRSTISGDLFSIHNFKFGSAPNPDVPGSNGESITWDGSAKIAQETGPGGGTMLYIPVGNVTASTCDSGAFSAVDNGSELPIQESCSGDDKTLVLRGSFSDLAPGQTTDFGVLLVFSGNNDTAGAKTAAAGYLGSDSAGALVDKELAAWEAWRTEAPGLSPNELAVWRQSEAVLRMGQVLEPYSESPLQKGHGMMLAGLPPGQWHSGWVRDGVYAIVAMARSGHFAEAKAGIDFFLNADAGRFPEFFDGTPYRISTVRYYGNGIEDSDFSGQATRNIEIDGWGLVLWAARTYVDASGDTEWLNQTTQKGDTVYEALKQGVAEAIAATMEPSGLMIADASIWEVHWGNRQHFLYTSASAARGLCDMGALARRMENTADQSRYAELSDKIVSAIRTSLVDQNGTYAGSLEKLATGSNYRDGSVVEAFTWDLVPTTDPTANTTMNEFSKLTTPVGGFKRIEGSSDQYDTDEWILIDLRASEVFRRLGNTERSENLLEWVSKQATANYNLIPELYNTNSNAGTIGRYSGSIPMVGYGAGAYLLTQLHKAGRTENRDCGTEDPNNYPDAGAFADAGPFVDGGGNGADTRTGTACLCQNSGPPSAWHIVFCLAILAYLRPGKSRARGGINA